MADGEQRWTVKNEDTGESVCHILCNSNMATDILFQSVAMLLFVVERVEISSDKLWFGTKLDDAMAQEIDAFELFPFFDVRHQTLLQGRYR